MINESNLLAVASSFVDLGFRKSGYQYFNIDDCWLERYSDSSLDLRPEGTKLVPDVHRFPNGFSPLVNYLHSNGIQFGIYSDCGSHTCQVYYGSPEWAIDIDSNTFLTEFQSTYLKLDGCFADKKDMKYIYAKWSKSLKAAAQREGHHLTFSCSWPAYALESSITDAEKAWKARIDDLSQQLADMPPPESAKDFQIQNVKKFIVGPLSKLTLTSEERNSLLKLLSVDPESYEELKDVRDMSTFDWDFIGSICHLWRIYEDIYSNWTSTLAIIKFWTRHQHILSKTQGPGRIHDPDMMLTGKAGVSNVEGRTQLSMWSMWSSPIIMGHDLKFTSPRTAEILNHKSVLEINQDPLVQMAVKVGNFYSLSELAHRAIKGEDISAAALSFWKKNLEDEENYALAILNTGDSDVDQVTFDLHERFQLNKEKEFLVYDVWADHSGHSDVIMPKVCGTKNLYSVFLTGRETLLMKVRVRRPDDPTPPCWKADEVYMSPGTVRDVQDDFTFDSKNKESPILEIRI